MSLGGCLRIEGCLVAGWWCLLSERWVHGDQGEIGGDLDRGCCVWSCLFGARVLDQGDNSCWSVLIPESDSIRAGIFLGGFLDPLLIRIGIKMGGSVSLCEMILPGRTCLKMKVLLCSISWEKFRFPGAQLWWCELFFNSHRRGCFSLNSGGRRGPCSSGARVNSVSQQRKSVRRLTGWARNNAPLQPALRYALWACSTSRTRSSPLRTRRKRAGASGPLVPRGGARAKLQPSLREGHINWCPLLTELGTLRCALPGGRGSTAEAVLLKGL